MPDTVHELVAARTVAHPDRVAVVAGSTTLTYRELTVRADRLAGRLAAHGVTRGAAVGVFLPRSAEFVVAMLAILRAGGHYVPLDPEYPAPRLALMLDAVGAPVVVTDGRFGPRLPARSGPVLRLGEPHADLPAPVVDVHPDDLAYTMFTSGSTGVPKGVAIRHRGVVRLVSDPGCVRLSDTDVVLHLSSPSFDAATFDVWGALANGGRLVVAPPGRLSVLEIGALLRAHAVTTAFFPTGLFHLMVDERLGDLAGVRQVVVGGDVLSARHAHRLVRALPDCRLVNGYGPTEGTTFTTFHEVRADEQETAPVPIGRPLARTRVLVLDAGMEPVPTGEIGQLYAGGDGLARGYLDPALTAERFVPDPWLTGRRLYATGDLVRRTADGELAYLGRVDRQIKRRGFRVEPGEIETALRADPDVRDAVVIPDGDTADSRRLVAYLVADSTAGVRERVRRVLPDHLVPDVWVTLDALPLNENGKVDRHALPTPDPGPAYDDAELSGEESAIAEIWQEILELTRVGRHDDFFDLGGHSLLANRIVSRVRRSLGVEIPLSAVFDHPTVAELAAVVRGVGTT